ncbi:MAG: hypothetical protein WAT36_13355 [Chromatiaceae bacterium]
MSNADECCLALAEGLATPGTRLVEVMIDAETSRAVPGVLVAGGGVRVDGEDRPSLLVGTGAADPRGRALQRGRRGLRLAEQ